MLNDISNEWLSDHNTFEMRFSVGWFDKAYLNTCPILIVRNSEDLIEAFANIILEFQADEVTVDMMRHIANAEQGQMDFLFVSLFDWAKAQGYARFNFGLSALSGIGEKPEDPAFERALAYVYEHVHQFYNFKGVHAFKDKYRPAWSPRYLIYQNLLSLPSIGTALIRANTGNDLSRCVYSPSQVVELIK